jgi:hypothetical protein
MIDEFTDENGTKTVGNGPGYLIFYADGRVGLRGARLEVSVPLSRFKRKDVKVGEATIGATDLQRGNGGASGYSGKLSRFVERLLIHQNEAEFSQALKAFASVIKAARVLRLGSAAPAKIHRTFRDALRQFAKRKRRAPTKGELRRELELFGEFLTHDRVTQLCLEHGFGWLATSKPGRGKKVEPPP